VQLNANLLFHSNPHAPTSLTCLLQAVECGRKHPKAVFVLSLTPVDPVLGEHQVSYMQEVTIRYKICFGTSRSKVCQILNSHYDSCLLRSSYFATCLTPKLNAIIHVIFTVHFDSISSIITNKCTLCISVTVFTLHMFRLWSSHQHGTLVGSLHWL
jgi:hypothetical protein